MVRTGCLVLAVVGLLQARALGETAPAAKTGDVVLAADFEGQAPLEGWAVRGEKIAADVGYQGGRALMIECPARPAAMAGGSAFVERPLPVQGLRGCTLLFSAMVKAEGVSARPNPWNGIKFMAPTVAGGVRSWPQGEIGVGTFDWQPAAWQTHVVAWATEMRLLLGLENVTGKVWFDNVRITVRRPPAVPRPAQAGPVYKGHNLPRLRGAMVSPDATDEDLRVLGREWKANLIRWQLCSFKPRIDTGDLAAYNALLESHLRKLDAALPACEKYGLMVVVDLHTGPGHWAPPGRSLFTSAACQERFVEIWREIARRYKNSNAVWGYDLLNEPIEGAMAEGLDDWQGLAERAARAVREIDPQRTIIVEPAPWGGPAGLEQLRPLQAPNVVYSVHMYIPHAFTHQGVYADGKPPSVYPGTIEGKAWDKAALEAALRPVADFQKAYGAHVFIGEFSAIRWAPEGSAYRYLRDVIDICEAHGWDWTYHAFREWQGWSAEHGPDKADTRPAAQPTDRQKLLCEWFAKNEKPRW